MLFLDRKVRAVDASAAQIMFTMSSGTRSKSQISVAGEVIVTYIWKSDSCLGVVF
ncbi:MAG: hypothetical protein GX796_07180 [Clostridiaceae bacterium]|nr:hypothetical protein [Clostridiaceae bacterium]